MSTVLEAIRAAETALHEARTILVYSGPDEASEELRRLGGVSLEALETRIYALGVTIGSYQANRA